MLAKHCVHRKSWRLLSVVLGAIMLVSYVLSDQSGSSFASAIPMPLYPQNYATTMPGTYPPIGIPTFSWTSVEGAIKYSLQVDNDIAFTPPIFLNITTSNTTYTPTSKSYLFADGEWYWRVRLEQPGPVGEWSETMVFIKSWAKYDENTDNKPTLLAPDAGASLGFFTDPVFAWTPVIGSVKYRFQISLSPDGFSSPVYSIDAQSTTHQPAGTDLVNGEYYWRVIPLDASGYLGASSEIRLFALSYGTFETDPNLVPTLIAPLDDLDPSYEQPIFTPTFHWTAVQGAEHYRLEYTTAPACDFSGAISIATSQMFYTPSATFPNDVQYCWHVRVESGSAQGAWSETWHFQKKWALKPRLLTPTISFQDVLYPLFSWTPVPGASSYKIEISKNSSLNTIFESEITANTIYAPQSSYDEIAHYYWRVTPIDAGGNPGVSSEIWDFVRDYTSAAPDLVYPFYYYPPNDPNEYGENLMDPVEDRTVAYPIFIWHRVMAPAETGGVYANAYRIQVDDVYPPLFTDPVWEYDTENTSASPTVMDDFHPVSDQDYYWRVCPLDQLAGSCMTNPATGSAWWSQTWLAQFDDRPEHGAAIPPTNGDTPELLRPAQGQELIETTPLLEWLPLRGATQYQVEIDRDPNFTTVEPSNTAIVDIPAYSPWWSIAQRSLGRTDYGTYYWRVRGHVGSAWTNWSDPWRFEIASQSEWRYNRTLGNPANRLLIGTDHISDATGAYDLSTLYASQSGAYLSDADQYPAYYFFGFNANLSASDMTYVIYIDLDHVDGSGAPSGPPSRDYPVTTVLAHLPEYAIYVDNIAGVVDAQNTSIYKWDGASWIFVGYLNSLEGAVFISDGYIELQIPIGTIGINQVNGGASLILFSVNPLTNTIEDSVPSDPNVPGTAELSRFSAVSDRMNLTYPPGLTSGDPTTLPSLLPFYWDWPTGSNPSTPFAGSILEVSVDPDFAGLVGEFNISSADSYLGQNQATFLNDLGDDNRFYWRVQPRYYLPGYPETSGAWTGSWSFRRSGFKPRNLRTSVDWATPSFTWDMVEGANTYILQLSTDPDFTTTIISQETPATSFTPLEALAQGDYYWRVRVKRHAGIFNDWSDVMHFNLTLPTPTGLTPNGAVVDRSPTFCWDPIIKLNEDIPFEPLLTAWKYKVQVSQDESFSAFYDTVETHNNCWTPRKAYDDGKYYWRVAMLADNERIGPYSAIATFTKQYPHTTLISPVNISTPATPTFDWTPVDGAATYHLEVSLYPSFSPLYDVVDTINTQFTPIKTYTPNKIYYWRIAIRDGDGNQGPFNRASFVIGQGHYLLPLITQ